MVKALHLMHVMGQGEHRKEGIFINLGRLLSAPPRTIQSSLAKIRNQEAQLSTHITCLFLYLERALFGCVHYMVAYT